jgi:urease accessory protein
MKHLRSRIAFSAAIAVLPVIAQAHPGHDAGASYAAGLLHPLGFDHLMALLAVGLLSARMGGRALLAIPCAFLILLAAGIALGLAGIRLDFVEAAISTSILVCAGLAVSPPRHLPVATSALAALFAIFHGNAHGTEIVSGVERIGYAAGLMTGSAAVIALTMTAVIAGSATWTAGASRR